MSHIENPPPPPLPPPPANDGCGAVALIVIGALILVPSGLCTAILGVGAVIDLNSNTSSFWADLSDVGPWALMVIAVAVAGFLMIRAGLRMQKRK
jgi:hypothetical protein